MDAWITFWKYACLVGFSAFYLLVLVIIPLGAVDLRKLFRTLAARGENPDDDNAT